MQPKWHKCTLEEIVRCEEVSRLVTHLVEPTLSIKSSILVRGKLLVTLIFIWDKKQELLKQMITIVVTPLLKKLNSIINNV